MTPSIKIKDWSAEERPREKLLLYGAKALSTSELLAILLRSGNKDHTAVDVAKMLLSQTGHSLKTLSRSGIEELCKTKGVGLTKATTILAAFEIANRIAGETTEESPTISSASDAVRIMRPLFYNLQHEECWVLYLNRQNKIIHKECLSKGGTHSTIMDPKLIIKKGIDKLANGIILFHNHPSGNPRPGSEDIRQTKLMRDALAMLDILLIDHIIIASDKYYSFAENGGI